MCIGAGLMGPKSENVEKVWVFEVFFKGSREAGGRQELEKVSEPDRPGRGRGRVNLPPKSLFWRFWRFGGFVVCGGLYAPRGQRSRRITC